MGASIHIPAIRFGKPYRSLDEIVIDQKGSGDESVTVSQVNAGLVRRDIGSMSAAFEKLGSQSAGELVASVRRAGDLFMEATLPCGIDGPEQGPEEYLSALSATTGLPLALCRSNMKKLHAACSQMDAILNGLTRGIGTGIFDDCLARQNGVEVSYFPAADVLGVVLPSNSPGVNSLWLPAIAMKVPVALKPGREDPWTPYRLVQALIAGGVPREAFGFYPAGHDGAGLWGRQRCQSRRAGIPADGVFPRHGRHDHPASFERAVGRCPARSRRACRTACGRGCAPRFRPA